MIEKYQTDEMSEIWSEQNKYDVWWDIERAVVHALVERGDVARDDLKAIDRDVSWSVEAIKEKEREVKHDILAFLEVVGESVGERSGLIHRGLTSSDVKDTEKAMRSRESITELLKQIESLEEVLEGLARKHQDTVMMGRTHAVHAEPITFGLKVLVWLEEFRRQKTRLEHACEQISVGKLSGAVGTFAALDPEVEEFACEQLGLQPAAVSNQVLQRDRHAEVMTTMANIAGSIEKIAVEIRNLQRTEILEVEENFGSGQKGSSAMPHKKNPIVSERLSGQARVVRSYASSSLETQSLWHERDLSNSSTERIVFPDAFHLVHYMLKWTTELLDQLIIHEDHMRKNLEVTHGLIFSQRVMLALAEQGWDRERAYETVQKWAMESWETGKSFRELVEQDDEIMEVLGQETLDQVFDPRQFLKNVERIYQRVFTE